MALTPQEFALFQAHLQARCNPPIRCPMCNSLNWSVNGPVVMLEYNQQFQMAVVQGGGAPVVIMTCSQCFFVRSFAWMPILAAAGVGNVG